MFMAHSVLKVSVFMHQAQERVSIKSKIKPNKT